MEELSLYTQQLAAHKAQQCIAREQLAALEEAAQHEEDYRQKESDEVCKRCAAAIVHAAGSRCQCLADNCTPRACTCTTASAAAPHAHPVRLQCDETF
jgi:hypothetical protein